MERVRRLAQFWNWLPAFRAVAETEHLPTAAKDLGVGAPGLSRTIKLVENAIGEDLFERRARRLVLNEAGHLFLQHVRDAMRRVDDGLLALGGQSFTGGLKVAASNSTSLVLVLPALETLAQTHPKLIPDVQEIHEDEVSELLLKGRVDLALLEHRQASSDLSVELLTTVSAGIYCAATHALAQQDGVDLETCLDHAFVAPSAEIQDDWPLNIRRKVALRVNALNLAMAACANGDLLALLPNAAASRYPAQLRRLPVGDFAERAVFMARRPMLGQKDRVAVLMQALRDVAKELSPGT